MSATEEQRSNQYTELEIQREIRKAEDKVVQWIEKTLDEAEYPNLRNSENDKKLEESQFRNVVRVADTTESAEVVKNFLRYQTGRDKKWGRGQNSLAERIIQDIDGNLRKIAEEISEQTSKEKFKEIWLDLIRRYLGYGSRYLLYLNTPKEDTSSKENAPKKKR
jgi:hypothetical protein